jgi:hypothetical protein
MLPNPYFVTLGTRLVSRAKGAQKFEQILQIKKVTKLNDRTICEHSPYLVTLLLARASQLPLFVTEINFKQWNEEKATFT